MDADGGASFPFCLQHEVCEFLGLEESSPSSATPEELMVVCVWCAVCVWGEAGECGCRNSHTLSVCVCGVFVCVLPNQAPAGSCLNSRFCCVSCWWPSLSVLVD